MDNEEKKDGRGHAPHSIYTRIKPGEVRNPKGRPKGATGRKADWDREMKRLVTVTLENGKEVTMSMRRCLYRTAILQARKDPKYYELVMALDYRYERDDTAAENKRRRVETLIQTGLGECFDDLTESDKIALLKRAWSEVPEDI
jgi:hypothetical protein